MGMEGRELRCERLDSLHDDNKAAQGMEDSLTVSRCSPSPAPPDGLWWSCSQVYLFEARPATTFLCA